METKTVKDLPNENKLVEKNVSRSWIIYQQAPFIIFMKRN